ncbi:MAG: hypothetical protein RBT78_11340 [Kiritimatiellia bacterium]|nr:hypothetical protein [Kiritimatiellia bacterium]
MRLSPIPFRTTDDRLSTNDTRKDRRPLAARPSLCALLALLAGCTSPKTPEPAPEPPAPHAPEVVAADRLFEAGKTQEAITACVDIARKNPDAAGLADLQQRITRKLADERLAAAEKRAEATTRLHTADANRFIASPERYRQQRHVIGDRAPLRTAPTAMQKALQNPVTVHLVNADISAIIAQLGQSENINLIADSEITPKTLTLHAEKTPLVEVLEYIGRNLNVTFSVGENLIWVTPKEEPTSGVPMETRVYRLRKGLVGSELGKSAQGQSLFKGPEERNSSSSRQEQEKEGQGKDAQIGLLDSIQRFVPQPEGADLLFNDKVHALIVKNTRENLVLVEDLIEAMDVRPVQVLIEARFVTTGTTDLRKLGVEWLIDNRGNAQFDTGSLNTSDPWARGLNKVTPVRRDVFSGAFSGVDDTGAGGANLAYQFLLGDTALQAVLHALEKSGESRTVVVPRVTTLNNREARFRVGQDITYFEEVETDIMTSGSTYGSSESRDNVTYDYDTPMTVELGYSLIVTPSVGADLSSITLVLRPEISSLDKTSDTGNNGWIEYSLSSLASATREEPKIKLPIIARQYIETEAVVRSGETVVLGGLVDSSKSESTSGTPWLSTLPWIGHLFKTEEEEKVAKNILIFVTATLISDVGEELIPLNDLERYGLPVPDAAKVPDILKAP